MSRSTNALLLSALVLPGAGHLYLKHYRRAAALIAVSLVCLGVVVAWATQQAFAVLAQLESAGGVPDAGQLADSVTRISSGTNSQAVTIATLVLAGCWLVGIADAYWLGKRQDKRQQSPAH